MGATTHTIPRYLLEDALDAAGLDFEEAVREDVKGRGYRPSGLGIVAESVGQLLALFAALGREWDHEGDHPVDLAELSQLDQMGHGLILYLPGVTIS